MDLTKSLVHVVLPHELVTIRPVVLAKGYWAQNAPEQHAAHLAAWLGTLVTYVMRADPVPLCKHGSECGSK